MKEICQGRSQVCIGNRCRVDEGLFEVWANRCHENMRSGATEASMVALALLKACVGNTD